jgi:hypothetical protein
MERLLGISYGTAYLWIKELGIKLRNLILNRQGIQKVDVLELDELYTYIKKNRINVGSGLVPREIPKRFLAALLETEVKPVFGSSLIE